MDDSNARHAAYAGKDVDIMMSTVDQFAIEAANGLPGGVLVVTDESWGSDGILAKASIHSVKDLRGKRVAYTPGLAGEYLLARAIENAGLKRTDITWVPLDDPSGGLAAFNSGQVAATVSWEPHLSEAVENKTGHILLTSRDIPEAIVDILAAKNSVTDDPTVLRAFLDGWFEAERFMQANPDEANAIIAKGLSVKPEDVKGMRDGLKLASVERNRYFLAAPTPAQTRIAQLLDQATAYWKNAGKIPAGPPAATRIPEPVVRYFAQ
jgi:NitT/TauT family transport system substrate-binding protein